MCINSNDIFADQKRSSPPSSEAEWVSLIKKMQETGGRNPDDSQLPRKESDLIAKLSKMKDCGIDDNKAIEILKERREKYIEACLSFNNRNVKR